MGEPTDSELVSRFQAGDRDAFGLLVARWRLPVYRVARGSLRSHELADDATQEAFVKAWHGLMSFRGESSFKTWIFRIAMNAAHDVRARERSRAALGEQLAREGEELVPRQARPRPVEDLIREQELERMRSAMERLPDRQRETLRLRVVQGLSIQDVADVLGCPAGTVKANLHHAVANLRKQLGAESPAESDQASGAARAALGPWGRSMT